MGSKRRGDPFDIAIVMPYGMSAFYRELMKNVQLP